MIVMLAIVVALIAMNALYVAAEFGAVSVRRSQVERRAEEGSRTARGLLPIVRDARLLDRYVAACQIGITLSSLLLGAYGQAVIATALTPSFARLGGMQEPAAHSVAAIVVLLALTTLQMVFGELVPKSISLQSPLRMALATYVPMRLSLKLFSWFIAVLNGSGVLILKLLGMQPSAERHVHTPDEIEALIDESSEGGALPDDTGRPLRRALALGAREIGDLMVPRDEIEAVDVKCGSAELLRMAAESPFTRIPVYAGTLDTVLGIVHARDLAACAVRGEAPPDVRPLLMPVLRAAPDDAASEILKRMREEHRQTAIVVDDAGRTTGFITADDILEDLLGGIADEFKEVEAADPGDRTEAEEAAHQRVRAAVSGGEDER